MAKNTKPTSTAMPAPTPPAPDSSGASPSADLNAQIDPPIPDAQEPSLALLAEEEHEDVPPPPVPALIQEEPTSPPTPPALVEASEERSPEDELEWLEARRLELMARLKKPLPAPSSMTPSALSAPVSAKIAEAQRFGVLATWKGPGTYGGTYYTLKGERAQNPTGLTIGYFPLACVKKFKDQFSVQD